LLWLPRRLGKHLGLVLIRKDRVGKLGHRHQQVFLAHDEGGGVETGEFEAVAVGDGVGGAGLDTVAAEDAAVVVDVVDLGVTLGRGDALFFGVLGCLDVDAVGGAGCGAEEAGDTLFEALFIALELVFAAEALLKFGSAHGAFAVGIVFDLRGLKDFLEGDAHTLGDGCGVANDRHILSIRQRSGRLKSMKTRVTSLSWFVALCLAGMGAGHLDAQTAPQAAMEQHEHVPAPASTSLTLTIDGKATTLTVADLQAMPQKTISVHNEHTKVDETYSGVLLGDLLAKYGLPVSQATHRKMLRSYLVAEGTDKYWVLYSVTEIEGSEHDGSVIVATSVNGKPLGEDGQLKLVDSGDKKPQRWVRNLTAITVKSAE
jgi:hypothetical protein